MLNKRQGTVWHWGPPCKRGHNENGGSYRYGHPHGACVACMAKKSRTAKRQSYNKTYYQQNTERLKQASQEYRSEHDYESKRYAQDKPFHAARYKKWCQDNPEKAAARCGERRATRNNATPKWVNRAAIAALYAEARRRQRETGIPHHVDHIIPLRHPLVCGLHVEHNLQVVPASINGNYIDDFL